MDQSDRSYSSNLLDNSWYHGCRGLLLKTYLAMARTLYSKVCYVLSTVQSNVQVTLREVRSKISKIAEKIVVNAMHWQSGQKFPHNIFYMVYYLKALTAL